MNITLRQAKPEDVDWLDEFYEGLMRPYVELTHDWDEKRSVRFIILKQYRLFSWTVRISGC